MTYPTYNITYNITYPLPTHYLPITYPSPTHHLLALGSIKPRLVSDVHHAPRLLGGWAEGER